MKKFERSARSIGSNWTPTLGKEKSGVKSDCEFFYVRSLEILLATINLLSSTTDVNR